MIQQRELRAAAGRVSRVAFASNIDEAIAAGKATAFLCHSHQDRDLAIGLKVLLKEHGWDLYIDWMDEELPSSPTKVTANKIKRKIGELTWFLFLATANSVKSRWCPWEIGFADALKPNEKIVIIPTEDETGAWHGNEYLQLYRRITDAIAADGSNRSGIALFETAADTGTWVSGI